MKNPRSQKAYEAMKALDISHDKVKPVLKRLYKLYGKNWDFIEAEDYRVLVDVIFEEDEEVETKRKKPLDLDAPESPSKKLHVESVEDEASSVIDISHTRVVHKEGPETSGQCPLLVETEPVSCSAMHKGKGQLSPNTVQDSVKITSERASSSSGSKVLADAVGPFPVDLGKLPRQCRSKKFTIVDSEQCGVGVMPLSGTASKISAIPDLAEASSSRNISTKSSQCVDPAITKECKLDIISSSSGDVKLCCISTTGKTTSTPDTDGVLKSVEEKFLRKHRFVGPSFSLKNLLEELCDSFFEPTANKKRVSPRTSPEVISQDRMEIVEEQELEGCRSRPQLFIDDIAKGEETVKISLVDEHANTEPPKFFYIPKNIIYQKAIVNISLARISDEDCCSSCSGDCLSSAVPCACTRITDGEFAYTSDGLLNPKFLKACLSGDRDEVYCKDCPIERAKNPKKPRKCKGHAVRKFIKECWSKCGCSMQCGNRVVQRGISRKLQVFWTAGRKGWGLRTTEDLPKGAFVCEYVGEVVTNTELDDRNRQSNGNERHTYPIHLDADWDSESILDDDFALCLDATNYGNVARFINHKCCDANLLDIPVEVETVDHHYYHVAFFTTQEVKAYEELSWDYGIDFDDKHHPIKAFQCHCGSTECRDKSHKGSRSKAKASAR